MSLLIENFRKYLLHVKGDNELTAMKYTGNVLNLFELVGIKTISDIDADKINSMWLADIWAIVIEKRGLKKNTVITYQSALKNYFKFLEENGFLPEGTHQKVNLAKPDEVNIYGLTHDEQDALLNYIPNHLRTERERRDAALIMLMWGTGCRVSEVVRLKVHKTGYIYTDDPMKVSGSFRMDRGNVYVHFEHAKNHRDRSLSVPKKSIAYLNHYLKHRSIRANENLFLNCAWNQFSGNVLTKSGAIGAVKRVFEKCSITRPPDSITHALRHTAVEKWLLDGIPFYKIVTQMGWKDDSSLQPYLKRSRELVREFGDENNVFNKHLHSDKKIKEFEDLLVKRYVQG